LSVFKNYKAILALDFDALPIIASVVAVLQGSASVSWFQWKSFKISIHNRETFCQQDLKLERQEIS